ncbi:MAG TPA: hypothetical protein VF183_02200, partial [Acidimicrobiales bacterium]
MRLDHLDFINVCRDEGCELEDLHVPGTAGCGSAHGRRNIVNIAVGQLLRDLTFAQVTLRTPKTFQQIYRDVIDDFGTISERSVYRAVRELRNDRRIALIVPAGSRAVVHLEGIRGAYVRYDSPLLWQRDGLRSLMDLT